MIKITKLVILYLSFIFLPFSLFAESIAIVASNKIPFSQDVITGIKSELAQYFPKYSVEMVSSDDPGYIDVLKNKNHIGVFVVGFGATKVALALPNTPVIFSMVAESAVGDLAQLCRKPDTNITGVFLSVDPARQISIIRRVFPSSNKLYVLHDGVSSLIADELKSNAFGLTVVSKKVLTPNDVPGAVNNIGAKEHDVFVILADSTIYNMDSISYVLKHNVDNHILTVGYALNVVKAGALLAYIYDYNDMGRQAVEIFKKIAANIAPSQIPPQRCRKVGYALNLKLADNLNVKFDPGVIQDAGEIVR